MSDAVVKERTHVSFKETADSKHLQASSMQDCGPKLPELPICGAAVFYEKLPYFKILTTNSNLKHFVGLHKAG